MLIYFGKLLGDHFSRSKDILGRVYEYFLSQFASAVIYVVKADATPYQVAQNGLKKLRRVNAPLLGVVLNQLDLEKAEKYYGEYSGYKSYSGYKKYGYTRTYGSRSD